MQVNSQLPDKKGEAATFKGLVSATGFPLSLQVALP